MKVIDYKPKAKGFEGSIKLEMPSYPQRLKYFKECNFDLGKTDNGYEAKMGSQNIDALIKMLDIAKKHVKSVDLIREDTSYASFDEMLDDSSCDELCQEIAGVVINGIRVGGN